MARKDDNIKSNDPNLDDDYFLQELGKFIRNMRIAAGFPTIRSFVDTIDMSYSQYQGYEAGKNITIKILKRILFEFDLKVEDWLSLNIFRLQNDQSKLIERMRQSRVSHVISQVEMADSIEVAHKLNSKAAQRYIDILIHCHTPKSRSYILGKLLGMDDSHNTFKRIAGKLIDYGWLDYTDKTSKRSPEQGYFTTGAGKEVLRLGKE